MKKSKSPTDPYGLLEYAIGNEDDFICFDFAITDRGVWLHSVLNSETGHFIEDFQAPILVSHRNAVAEAMQMVTEAIEWCINNEVVHDEAGWNQDMYFFPRDLAYALMDETHRMLFDHKNRGAVRRKV